MRSQCLGQHHGGRHIQAHVKFELRQIERVGIVVFKHRGVVHHGIQSAHLCNHLRRQTRQSLRVTHVGRKAGRSLGQGFTGLHGVLGFAGRVVVVHGHTPSLRGQRQGDGTTQPFGRAGDQHHRGRWE